MAGGSPRPSISRAPSPVPPTARRRDPARWRAPSLCWCRRRSARPDVALMRSDSRGGMQAPQVWREISGTLGGNRVHRLARGTDAGEDHEARQPGRDSAGDVGVEPIAHLRAGAVNVPRLNASFIRVGWGLPATSGSCPVAARGAATIEPLPGSSPRSGRKSPGPRSPPPATLRRGWPALPRPDPAHAVLGECPCTTAAGASSNIRTGLSPTLLTSPASASVPRPEPPNPWPIGRQADVRRSARWSPHRRPQRRIRAPAEGRRPALAHATHCW